MAWMALTVMIVAVLAHHLGLPQAIASVVAKIARCPICLTFWATLFVLMLTGSDFIIAVMLSIFMAYLSSYWGLVMVLLQRLYRYLWERIKTSE